jgi:thioredoxin reductase (NADPH)
MEESKDPVVSGIEKLVIIGSGPAGLTAAIYAARGNLNPLVIAGRAAGGQLMLTTDVDDFPGFPDGIQGPELMMSMRKQAERFDTRFVEEDVVSVDFKNQPFTITTETKTIKTESVIVATGASAMWLGLPSEDRLSFNSFCFSSDSKWLIFEVN